MVLVFVDAGGGVKYVVAEVFPDEEENGGGGKGEERTGVELTGLGVGDGTACADGHDSYAVHGWLERGEPEFFPICVVFKRCADEWQPGWAVSGVSGGLNRLGGHRKLF